MRFSCLAMLLIAACADTLKSTSIAYAPPKVTSEYATVIFVQQGAFMQWRYLDGRHFLGKTDRGAYFEAQVQPGSHRFYVYHPEGSAWSKDGFCHGFDAQLDPGKLYVVMVRFISPLNGKLEESRANMSDDKLRKATSATDLNITVRPLRSRSQLGMNAAGYFAKLEKLWTDRSEGQKEFDEWFPTSQELQRKNLSFKYEVEESKIHTWADFPPPCTTANTGLVLAAEQSFPVEDFGRKAGKRFHFVEASLVDIPKLAERECGVGVPYTVETKESQGTSTVRTTQREGAYDVTYDNSVTLKFSGGDIICDQR